jgi:hypothetical protein
MEIPLKRTLQDGGLGGHNNPTLLCLLERRRLLSFHVSGYVLSLGTGKRMNRKDGHPIKTQRNDISQWLHNHAVFRMGRSLGRCVDGDQVASRLFDVEVARFNVELPGPLRISDTAGMTALRKTAREGLTRSSQVFEETTNALVERFYFVLDGLPKREGDRFRCEGSIRCRGNSQAVISDLLRLQDDRLEFMTDSELLGELNIPTLRLDRCSGCQRYRKRVAFSVRNLTSMVNIYLRSGREKRRKISAFPQSIQWFVRRQQLDSYFGTPDHGSPGRLRCCSSEGHAKRNKPAVGLRKRKQPIQEVGSSKRQRY